MKIPIARSEITNKEILAIQKPLESGWVVQGPFVKEFEDKFSTFTGAKNSIAVTSCTTALHLSLAALGFKPGDEAIVPAFTWISTANVIEHLGGKVVFCDIDLRTFNIDPKKIEEKITNKTKAILPVHLFGLSVDMDAINQIAEKYNLWVVEDAACGFGSTYKDQHVGTFGNTGCFSFHPRKAITTGEGGMITTNDDALADKIRSMRDHGAEMSDYQRHHGSKPYLLAEHPYAGYNYRMTDIQASIGSTQMDRAEKIILERQEIASFYNKELEKINFFQLPQKIKNFSNGFQSYPCIYDTKKINISTVEQINQSRNKFMDNLQLEGVSTRPATHAVHMLRYYKEKYGIDPLDFPNAYISNECSISFPLFNGMSSDEIKYVVSSIKNCLEID